MVQAQLSTSLLWLPGPPPPWPPHRMSPAILTAVGWPAEHCGRKLLADDHAAARRTWRMAGHCCCWLLPWRSWAAGKLAGCGGAAGPGPAAIPAHWKGKKTHRTKKKKLTLVLPCPRLFALFATTTTRQYLENYRPQKSEIVTLSGTRSIVKNVNISPTLYIIMLSWYSTVSEIPKHEALVHKYDTGTHWGPKQDIEKLGLVK